MKKSTIILAAITICFGITTNIFAQYVTAEFMTYGANGTTLNKVRMDQPGVPYSNGVNGVSAQFFYRQHSKQRFGYPSGQSQ
ncbi:MAG: hypothetical protein H0X49_15660 [Acidobacteria bacterium]|nr:hypothetical protein [Acidobacteriota bacterium]